MSVTKADESHTSSRDPQKLKRVLFWAITLVPASLLVLTLVGGTLFGLAVLDVTNHGPYVRWYNNRLMAIAQRASLVGRPEREVERVLGSATYVDEGWNRTWSATGLPTADAEYVRTYNYAPYAFFPFAKFQVHCVGGHIRGLEMFDD